MDRDIAAKVVRHFDQVFDNINDALYLVNNSDVGALRQRFQSVLATVIAEIDLELLEPIFKEHPDLRPKDMEEIKD